MDSTGWGIIIGLIGFAALAALSLRRQRKIDPFTLATLILGLFSMPIACASIKAAIVNDPAELPSKWREYVAVAAALTIWLTAKKMYDALVGLLSPPADRDE